MLQGEADVPEGFGRLRYGRLESDVGRRCRIEASPFVEKVSGSRPGCP
jgi:hypothetical protein